MVVRRTIENLRARPQDEKTAIAASVAIGVVVVLFAGWMIFFFHNLAATSASNFANAASSSNSSDLQQAQQPQAYASTTQLIQSGQETIQLEEVGTSSEPSL